MIKKGRSIFFGRPFFMITGLIEDSGDLINVGR